MCYNKGPLISLHLSFNKDGYVNYYFIKFHTFIVVSCQRFLQKSRFKIKCNHCTPIAKETEEKNPKGGNFPANQTTKMSNYFETLLRKIIQFARLSFYEYQTSSCLHMIRRKLVRIFFILFTPSSTLKEVKRRSTALFTRQTKNSLELPSNREQRCRPRYNHRNRPWLSAKRESCTDNHHLATRDQPTSIVEIVSDTKTK